MEQFSTCFLHDTPELGVVTGVSCVGDVKVVAATVGKSLHSADFSENVLNLVLPASPNLTMMSQ